MSESTDAIDTAQLVSLIKSINAEYNVTEEMASLIPLKDHNNIKWFI